MNRIMTVYKFLILFILIVTTNSYGQTKPNFLFILVDDLGWADISPNNPHTFYETPSIQKLADEGMTFSNGYAGGAVCSPTRSGLMTGKCAGRTHFTAHVSGLMNKDWYLHELPLSEVTIAEALKEAKYATFFAGKWHLGGPLFTHLYKLLKNLNKNTSLKRLKSTIPFLKWALKVGLKSDKFRETQRMRA